MQNAHELEHRIRQGLMQNKIMASDEKLRHFCAFLTMLDKWNSVYNLTRIDDTQSMINLHLIDSLIVSPFLSGDRLLDVGCGGGLPGIPLAILNPHQHWTLLDKNGKKTRFLVQVVAELGLKNVRVVQERCEVYCPLRLFSCITARAFTSLALFHKLCVHLLQQDGVFIAMKGKLPTDEIADLRPHVATLDTIPLQLHGQTTERNLIIFTDNA